MEPTNPANNNEEDIFNNKAANGSVGTGDTPASVANVPGENIANPTKPAKSHKGLIISLSAGAVLLIGGAVAGYTVYRSQPAVIAADAITGLIGAKNLSVTGTYDIKFSKSYAYDLGVEQVTLSLDQNSSTPPASTTAKLEVKSTKYGDISLKFNEVIMQDGVIYLKVDSIEDTVDAVFNAFIDNQPDYAYCADGLTNCYRQLPIYKSQAKREYQKIKGYFSKTIELVNDSWWKIVPEEIINTMDAEFGLQVDNSYSDAYKCVMEKISNSSTSSELSSIYRKNQFISLTPYSGSDFTAESGGNLYNINIDPDAMVGFAKDTLNSKSYSDINGCLSKIEGFRTMSPSDVTDSDWNNLKTQATDTAEGMKNVYVEIDGWSHQLSNLHFKHTESGMGSAEANFKFGYNAPTVTAPSDAVDISDLLDTFYEDYVKAMRYLTLENE